MRASPVPFTAVPSRPTRWTVFRTPILSTLLAWLASLALWMTRWRTSVHLPEGRRAVIVVAPHTSHWDFPLLLAVALKHRIDARWIGTHRLFRGPGRILFRWLGGMPVDRSAPSGLVSVVVDAFRARDRLLLALAPEGTRFRVDAWKTGFYRIATGAGVPIGLAYADFGGRRAGVADTFDPTGDIQEDIDQIQRFYRDVIPRHPERFAPPALPDDNARGR